MHLIRQATAKDAAGIAVLGAHVWIHTYAAAGVSDVVAQYVLSAFRPERILALMNDRRVVVLVAEAQTNLVGYAVVRCDSCHGDIPSEVETLYVQHSFAGQGVGSALLARARDMAMQKTGNRSVWLLVNAQNEKAISFYRSRGMTQDGLAYFELGGTRHENKVMVAREP